MTHCNRRFMMKLLLFLFGHKPAIKITLSIKKFAESVLSMNLAGPKTDVVMDGDHICCVLALYDIRAVLYGLSNVLIS